MSPPPWGPVAIPTHYAFGVVFNQNGVVYKNWSVHGPVQLASNRPVQRFSIWWF
ncbi:uncharacterized protein DS421_3g88440 [Arachis hypogaea]|nr:uncharacterized protein DS421_3g88440 [Arachis hypogaea]